MQADFDKCLIDSYEYTGYAIRKYAPLCFADGTRESVGFQLGEQHTNITYYIDYTVIRFADVLLMHSELNADATGINRVRARPPSDIPKTRSATNAHASSRSKASATGTCCATARTAPTPHSR